MTIYNIISLVGGLAFFLFGMNVMSNYLEKMAGGRLENVLKKLTSNPLKSLALGAVVTIAIQSSSALTVMLVGLVNSGIMEFSQTIHVIMGSDIGTTLTSWILSMSSISSDNIFISMLKPENFSPIVALIGVILIMASKTQKNRDIGTILCGFAVLMFGMTLMSNSVSPLAEEPEFQRILVAFDNPFIGVLIGTAFTGVIQSSAASIGVLQALSKKAKRVPALHIMIKILGTIVWLTVYLVLRYALHLPFFGHSINAVQIAIFHSIFNLGTIALLMPFSKHLVAFVERMMPVQNEEDGKDSRQVLLDERLLTSPGLAVQQCRTRTVEMAKAAQESFIDSMSVMENYDPELIEKIDRQEKELDYLEDQLDTFLIKLSAKDLTDADSEAVSEMLHSITDFERIGDHAINMTKTAGQMRDLGVKFSKKAKSELAVLTQAVTEILQLTYTCFADDDEKKAYYVEPLEEVIDDLTKQIKNRHIERLQTGECRAELGIILTDVLTNCERVSDHCSNVAVCIIQTRNSSFETHGYLNAIKDGNEPEFVSEFDSYQDKYQLPANEPKKKKKDKDRDGRDKNNKEKDKEKDKDKNKREKKK